MAIDKHAGVTAFTHHLTGWLRRLMPPGPRLDRLTADLEASFADRPEPLTAARCRAVEARAQRHTRHLELHFDAGATAEPDTRSHGWPAVDPEQVRARAAGVREVRRLPDGTFALTLDTLDPVQYAGPYLQAAFALARGAGRLVVDLRGNGGGDPGTLALVAEHLLGDDAQALSEVIYRDRRRQWWTRARPAGSALTQDLVVLVSSHTYSSAEALAYHLQARGRAVIVGETTRGAADHVTPVRLTGQVVGLLPEATVIDAVTGTNWEGSGVRPDVACAAEKAWDVALALPVRDRTPATGR
ncbi:S41 family peptidase [Actinoplanes sp. DH11]|uniref:S41 family peptidase n=1 Tax=Actinoplanes sp. DH11 TaxID=2857011 RepID=UPI001E352F3A|nr:S41 family peptidase [Actinoplanes sp. DH11]